MGMYPSVTGCRSNTPVQKNFSQKIKQKVRAASGLPEYVKGFLLLL
jgi:hypothetical protein